MRFSVLVAIVLFCSCVSEEPMDVLLTGGLIYDGSGSKPSQNDIGISGNRIVFIGNASAEGASAEKVLDVTGLMVTPGFIDMHSHAVLDEDYGRDGAAFLYQGITSVAIGVDGGGTPRIRSRFEEYVADGVGVNVIAYVGHGAVRREILGMEDRAPTEGELQQMRDLVRQGMEEGAFGLSTGLFYTPGFYSETDEVIELARVAAEFDGIYDTHDRDLGASYQGVGYLESIREGIAIGETSGARVIFSHFNAQGAHNYGRAPEGARLIDEALARGVEVAAAQHVYTATQSSLAAYAIPRWASVGGREVLLKRFQDPETVARLDIETMAMLAIRGGAEKILIVDPRPELNGRTLAAVSSDWGLDVPKTVRKIITEANASVMNLELYDIENTKFLAKQEWMMTCTDGRNPRPDQAISHPRVYGAFTRKLRKFVLEEELITMPFAVKSMTGLAAQFLHLEGRGFLREGYVADIVALDRDRILDLATYQEPKQYSVGVVHVFVNGVPAIQDGKATGMLAGIPLLRDGVAFER